MKIVRTGLYRGTSNFDSAVPVQGTLPRIMTRCIHTGITIPECSCRACLLELVRTHAPQPAAHAAPTPPAPVDERLGRPQAA